MTRAGEAEGGVSLATSSRLKRALDGLRNSREYALPATAEYFSLLSSEMEKLRIDSTADPFDDAVVKSIESFLPYRNEAVELFLNLAANKDSAEARTVLHRFFEQIMPYMDIPEHVSRYQESDWDNFQFIIHELFLYAIAALIRFERFETASHLMGTYYYVPGRSRFGRDAMVSFVELQRHMQSLTTRNERLKSGRLSVRADLLKQRCSQIGIECRELMQADFVLFLRSELENTSRMVWWFPETLVYHHQGPFEVFARSRSKAYFNRAKTLLGIDDKDTIETLL